MKNVLLLLAAVFCLYLPSLAYGQNHSQVKFDLDLNTLVDQKDHELLKKVTIVDVAYYDQSGDIMTTRLNVFNGRAMGEMFLLKGIYNARYTLRSWRTQIFDGYENDVEFEDNIEKITAIPVAKSVFIIFEVNFSNLPGERKDGHGYSIFSIEEDNPVPIEQSPRSIFKASNGFICHIALKNNRIEKKIRFKLIDNEGKGYEKDFVFNVFDFLDRAKAPNGIQLSWS